MTEIFVKINELDAASFYAEFGFMKNQLSKLMNKLEPKEPTEYLTRKEVAKMFKVSLVTISEWTKKNILISYKIGNRIFYKRHEVEASLVQINSKVNSKK